MLSNVSQKHLLPVSRDSIHRSFTKAISEGKLDVIEDAVNEGQNVNAMHGTDGTMLHFAAYHGKLDIVNFLLSKGADPDLLNGDQRTPLFLATMQKHEAVALSLLPKTTVFPLDKRKQTVLFHACFHGMSQLTNAILVSKPDVLQGEISPDAKTTDRQRPLLHLASSKGHLDIVKLLLKAKATVDSTYTDVQLADPIAHESTPLMVAAHKGHHEVVQTLIDAKANVNQKTTETALVMASWPAPEGRESNIDVVKILLANKADVESIDSRGRTALILAANANRVPVVKELLDAKADLEKRTNDGHTALYAATLRGHVPVVELLLQHGANPNVKDNQGKALFAYAKKNKPLVEDAILRALCHEDAVAPRR